MRAFLKSIDECVSPAVVEGWNPPTIEVMEKIIAKPSARLKNIILIKLGVIEKLLTPSSMGLPLKNLAESALVKWLGKLEIFSRLYTRVPHYLVSKLQRLTTSFETLHTEEVEQFDDFYARLGEH